MPLNEEQWTVLARDLQRALARASGAPEWTDHNTHDPGITVLEALDYALTDLQYRGNALDDHARRLAQRVAERASALAGSAAGNDDCGHGLQRVNYAHGQLLGVDDFRAEQDYVRRRLSRHNRLLHGVGIVCGLDVTVERDDDGSRVVDRAGFRPRSRRQRDLRRSSGHACAAGRAERPPCSCCCGMPSARAGWRPLSPSHRTTQAAAKRRSITRASPRRSAQSWHRSLPPMR